MNVPDWATIDSDFELNYLVNINSDKDFNCHYLREDQVAVIRECNTDGTLCDLRQKKDDTQPWTLLEIKTFRDNGIEFNIPVCKKCFILGTNTYPGRPAPITNTYPGRPAPSTNTYPGWPAKSTNMYPGQLPPSTNEPKAANPGYIFIIGYKIVPKASPKYNCGPRAISPGYKNVPKAESPGYKKVP